MKLAVVTSYVTVVLALFFTLQKIRGNEKTLATLMRKILICTICAVLDGIFLVFATHRRFSLAVNGIFSASFSFLCVFLLEFAIEYTGKFKRIANAVFFRKILYAICAADVLIFCANIFFPFAFDVQTIGAYGEKIFRIVGNVPYFFHLGFCYVVLIAVFLSFVLKSIFSPPIFRVKYLSILIILLVTVFLDAVYVFSGFPIDISILFFAVAGFMLFYFSFCYTPEEIKKRFLLKVVGNDSNGVFCFDAEEELVYLNAAAAKLFKCETEIESEFKIDLKLRSWFSAWKIENPVALSTDSEYISFEEIELGDKKFFYKTKFKALFDERKNYVGCYFSVQDQSENRFAATRDFLTGLFNRKYFFEKTVELLKSNPKRDFCLIVSDIKDFKLINDVFGSQTGDEILKRIADFLRIEARESSVYGRYHGDKFALCIPAERCFPAKIMAKIETAMNIKGVYRLRTYIGIYKITDKTLPIDVMCDRAFLALNSVRQEQNGTYGIFTEELMEKAIRDQESSSLLSEAIRQNQFVIYIQPQCDENFRVRGGEVLVRWFHPYRGLIMPGDFLGIFEKTDAIAILDKYIWELACKLLRDWQDRGFSDFYLCVNISPKDFYFTDIYEIFTELAEKYQIDPKNLNLEITEDAILLNSEKQISLVKRLREYGFGVAMDDFGTGYSSFNMLKEVNINALKIDVRPFAKTKNSGRSNLILKSLVEMAKNLKMFVITEGVETPERANFLAKLGCDLFQGNFFALPMSVNEFEKHYLTNS